MAEPWPIGFADVLRARTRIAAFLAPTPLRTYAVLDREIGGGVRVFVKHENFQPTGAFKVRNGLSFLTAQDPSIRRRGLVAATRGNHGLGVAYAGALLQVPVTVCVPVGNNPEKNEMIQALGAELIEEGADYDAAVTVAERVVRERGAALVHSTNDREVIAGAATMTLEILEQAPDLGALVLGVGGGSQAVGALVVARRLAPSLQVYAVQAAGASAIHDAGLAGGGAPRRTATADTFADGLATRNTYELTFPALREGLAGFVTVTDAELASSLRLLLRTTHSLVEGAGAAGLAGLVSLRDRLRGRRVGIVLSGANIDGTTLQRVLSEAV